MAGSKKMRRVGKKIAYCWLQGREISSDYMRKKGCMSKRKQHIGICKYLQLYQKGNLTICDNNCSCKLTFQKEEDDNGYGHFGTERNR